MAYCRAKINQLNQSLHTVRRSPSWISPQPSSRQNIDPQPLSRKQELGYYRAFQDIDDGRYIGHPFRTGEDIGTHHNFTNRNILNVTPSLTPDSLQKPSNTWGLNNANPLPCQRGVQIPQSFSASNFQDLQPHFSLQKSIRGHFRPSSNHHIVPQGVTHHTTTRTSTGFDDLGQHSFVAQPLSPQTAARSPDISNARYKCLHRHCTHMYLQEPRGLRRWIDHQLLEHDEKKSWACGHPGCKGSGRKERGYVTHHTKCHKDCVADSCLFSRVEKITQRGRLACICFKCDEEVFAGPECARKFYEHIAAKHEDALLTGCLDTSQRDYSKDMRILFRARDELWSRYKTFVANTSSVNLDDLEFDETDSQVKKLRDDIEMKPFQDESEAFSFISALFYHGTSYLRRTSHHCAVQQPPTNSLTHSRMPAANTLVHSLLPQHEGSEDEQSDHSSPVAPIYDYAIYRPTGADNEPASTQWQSWSEGESQRAMSLYNIATDNDMSAGTGPYDNLGPMYNFFSSQDHEQSLQANSIQRNGFTDFTNSFLGFS